MESVQTISQTQKEKLFGQLLVSKGLLSHRMLLEALSEQKYNGGRLGEVLSRLNMLNEEQITSTLAEYLSVDYMSLDDISGIDMNIARLLPEDVAKRFCLIAVGEIDDNLVVAMADPLNVFATDSVELKTKRQVKPVIASAEKIRCAIEVIYHGSNAEEQRIRDLVKLEDEAENVQNDELIEDIIEADISSEIAATKAPVIRFVDLLLSQAVKSRASDIHVEPQENSMKIRMRIDGLLRYMVPPAKKMQVAVVARIKILSQMDIAERRLPQDGRFKIKAAGRDVDVRVSIIPTIYGEKIVMRILDASALNHNLDQLGFESERLAEFKRILSKPHGIIIVTGPTGSGKSTTLYSALNFLRDSTRNITTVEDPVEYRLAEINQIQVKPEIDLSFASCLRAILRQDPDIIFIGEIRDKETIDIAIKASLTGHLVLSTFHTNDAPSTISRLAYMGIEPYLLASTLNLIIAQRLVRKICDRCKEPITLDENVLQRLKVPCEHKNATFYHGRGCSNCGDTGYFGRLPIFEFLVLNDDIRQEITAGATEMQIRTMSQQKGYGGLIDSGVNNMLLGLTTAEEVLRTTFVEDVSSNKKQG